MPSGMGWGTDYPDADINFSIRLSELTKTRVSRRPDGEPNHLTVRLTDDNLFNCPYVAHGGHGLGAASPRWKWNGSASTCSRAGFCGSTTSGGARRGNTGRSRSAACCRRRSTRSGICRWIIRSSARCIPSRACRRFRRSGCGRPAAVPSEDPPDTDVVHGRGISDSSGRLMVFMTHNTDIADAWEREGEDPAVFLRVRSERVRARHQRRALRAQPLTSGDP